MIGVPGNMILDPCEDDSDGDGLTDEDESAVYGTNLGIADTDEDACGDGQELGTDPVSGGQRDPLNRWDYFNPTLDGVNRIDDISAVVLHYGQDEGAPGSTYDTRYDRTELAGGHPWQFDAPDGLIRIFDVIAAVRSYGHDCA
jgi:hypothetical protein